MSIAGSIMLHIQYMTQHLYLTNTNPAVTLKVAQKKV